MDILFWGLCASVYVPVIITAIKSYASKKRTGRLVKPGQSLYMQ